MNQTDTLQTLCQHCHQLLQEGTERSVVVRHFQERFACKSDVAQTMIEWLNECQIEWKKEGRSYPLVSASALLQGLWYTPEVVLKRVFNHKIEWMDERKFCQSHDIHWEVEILRQMLDVTLNAKASTIEGLLRKLRLMNERLSHDL